MTPRIITRKNQPNHMLSWLPHPKFAEHQLFQLEPSRFWRLPLIPSSIDYLARIDGRMA